MWHYILLGKSFYGLLVFAQFSRLDSPGYVKRGSAAFVNIRENTATRNGVEIEISWKNTDVVKLRPKTKNRSRDVGAMEANKFVLERNIRIPCFGNAIVAA